MKSINRITVAGHLGQDPETKTFDNGTTLTTISIATSSYMGKQDNGEPRYDTQWHKCSAFGKVGELIAQYCKKGDKLYVEGEMRYRTYQNAENITVYLSEIIVQDFYLCGSANENKAPY